MQIVWSIIVGLIVFVVAQWVLILVGFGPGSHLLAVLLGIAAALLTYFRAPWNRPRV